MRARVAVLLVCIGGVANLRELSTEPLFCREILTLDGARQRHGSVTPSGDLRARGGRGRTRLSPL